MNMPLIFLISIYLTFYFFTKDLENHSNVGGSKLVRLNKFNVLILYRLQNWDVLFWLAQFILRLFSFRFENVSIAVVKIWDPFKTSDLFIVCVFFFWAKCFWSLYSAGKNLRTPPGKWMWIIGEKCKNSFENFSFVFDHLKWCGEMIRQSIFVFESY